MGDYDTHGGMRVVLPCLRDLRLLEIAGHETVVSIVYFGMLLPFIFMVSWMHWNMREIALAKWAY